MKTASLKNPALGLLAALLLFLGSCGKDENYSAPKELLNRNAIYILFLKKSDSTNVKAADLGYKDFVLDEKHRSYPIASYEKVYYGGFPLIFFPLFYYYYTNSVQYSVLPLYVNGGTSSYILRGTQNDTIQCVGYNSNISYDEKDGMIYTTKEPKFARISFKNYYTSFDSERGITYMTVFK